MNVLSGLSGSIEILQKICVFAVAGVEDPRKYRIVVLATCGIQIQGLRLLCFTPGLWNIFLQIIIGFSVA